MINVDRSRFTCLFKANRDWAVLSEIEKYRFSAEERNSLTMSLTSLGAPLFDIKNIILHELIKIEDSKSSRNFMIKINKRNNEAIDIKWENLLLSLFRRYFTSRKKERNAIIQLHKILYKIICISYFIYTLLLCIQGNRNVTHTCNCYIYVIVYNYYLSSIYILCISEHIYTYHDKIVDGKEVKNISKRRCFIWLCILCNILHDCGFMSSLVLRVNFRSRQM